MATVTATTWLITRRYSVDVLGQVRNRRSTCMLTTTMLTKTVSQTHQCTRATYPNRISTTITAKATGAMRYAKSVGFTIRRAVDGTRTGGSAPSAPADALPACCDASAMSPASLDELNPLVSSAAAPDLTTGGAATGPVSIARKAVPTWSDPTRLRERDHAVGPDRLRAPPRPQGSRSSECASATTTARCCNAVATK